MNAEFHFKLQQFYYREARMLDERRYQDWTALLSEQVQYLMPSRYVAQRDSALRGQQAFLDEQCELQSQNSDCLPLRDENWLILKLRADRACHQHSWADNPPARTRRHISNIEWLESCDGQHQILSNFLLYFSRYERDNTLYSGQRRDILQESGDDFVIVRREVRLDWNCITGPTVGLFF